jgi:hypothetical protein
MKLVLLTVVATAEEEGMIFCGSRARGFKQSVVCFWLKKY